MDQTLQQFLGRKKWPNHLKKTHPYFVNRGWFREVGTFNKCHIPNRHGIRALCGVPLSYASGIFQVENPSIGERCAKCEEERLRREHRNEILDQRRYENKDFVSSFSFGDSDESFSFGDSDESFSFGDSDESFEEAYGEEDNPSGKSGGLSVPSGKSGGLSTHLAEGAKEDEVAEGAKEDEVAEGAKGA